MLFRSLIQRERETERERGRERERGWINKGTTLTARRKDGERKGMNGGRDREGERGRQGEL